MSGLLVAAIVGATILGDALQTIGMRRHGEIHDFRPGALGRAAAALARNWCVIAAVAKSPGFHRVVTLPVPGITPRWSA